MKAHDFPFPYLHDERQSVARTLWGGLYAGTLSASTKKGHT